MRIIIVHWHDAGSGATKEEASSHHRQSVGYESEMEPGYGVWIQMEPDESSHPHFIPWGMIDSIQELAELAS